MVDRISKNIVIRFLGGTQEVGRSAIAVKSGETQILLDYGVMIDHEPGFPMHIPPREVDAIVLSHAHLDHSGSAPLFHIRSRTPVYGTPITFEIARILISDFVKLSGYYLPYEYIDLQNMLNCSESQKYREPFRVGDFEIELLNAGHIPGSAQTIVETDKKRLLYTSDFNVVDTRLLNGADQSYGDVDAIIIEGTYANEDHMERREVEKTFIEKINSVVERGGTVLVPAFSVGRSQEILCVLAAHHFEYPVSIDGMAEDINEILMRNPSFLRDPDLFMESVRMADWIKGWKDRRMATRKPGVIVSPAGMLKGGNAVFYMSKIAGRSENAIYMVSFQIPGTPGHELLTSKRCIIGGKMSTVKAEIEHFDFTSHCGRAQLLDTLRKAGSDTKIFVMHGAEENCQELSKSIREEMGLEAFSPTPGEVFQV